MATQNVSEEQLQSQFTYIDAVARLLGDKRPKAYTHTFGCQQNEADTERIRGMLSEMGYEMTDTPDEADFILFNTCAVREHAEDRAFGNIGALRHLKKERPDIVIAMCGCMAQQEKNVEKIKKSYPQVNLLFGTHALWRFPSLLYRVLTEKKRVFDIGGEDDIAEGLPVLRAKGAKAWLSIMYGCNNFCTYCIVPYVRGRERSRRPEEIEKELRELVAAGYKEITLLGQNVNSYGKDLGIDVDFADLLRRLNAVPGDFWLRFMTSHPKDASPKLFSAMAECDKVAKQLHLPFQSGSDEGFGSENMTQMKMFTPAATKAQIVDFIADACIHAGSNPCPPIVIGVGLGGTSDKAAYLAKRALLRPVDQHNVDPLYAEMEQQILDKVNASGVGPQGLGGTVTALACAIEPFGTHIAGLPCVVNISCHVTRHAEGEL